MPISEVTPTLTQSGYGKPGRLMGTGALRAALASTTSYVQSNYVDTLPFEKVIVEVAVVWVDSTSTQWYASWSDDAATWTAQQELVDDGTNITLANHPFTKVSAASWTNRGEMKRQGRYLSVYIKKTGGVGADTAAINFIGLQV